MCYRNTSCPRSGLAPRDERLLGLDVAAEDHQGLDGFRDELGRQGRVREKVFGRCASDACLDVGSSIVLARYERWRRTDAALSAAAFDGLNRLFSSDWTLLRTARSAGLALVDRLPVLKQFFVAEAAGLTGEIPKLLRGEPV